MKVKGAFKILVWLDLKDATLSSLSLYTNIDRILSMLRF